MFKESLMILEITESTEREGSDEHLHRVDAAYWRR